MLCTILCAVLMAVDYLHNPLWHYATETYQHSNIAALLLRLQDEHQLNVNVLLALAWVSREGYHLDQSAVQQLVESIASINDEVIVPLRSARRGVKLQQSTITQPAFPKTIYEQLKSIELRLEQQLIAILFSVFNTLQSTTAVQASAMSIELESLLAHNIGTYVNSAKSVRKNSLEQHVLQLIQLLQGII